MTTLAEALRALLAAHPHANDGRAGYSVLVTPDQVEACRAARTALAQHDAAQQQATCQRCGGSGEETVLDTTQGPHGDYWDIDCRACSGTGATPEAAQAQQPVADDDVLIERDGVTWRRSELREIANDLAGVSGSSLLAGDDLRAQQRRNDAAWCRQQVTAARLALEALAASPPAAQEAQPQEAQP